MYNTGPAQATHEEAVQARSLWSAARAKNLTNIVANIKDTVFWAVAKVVPVVGDAAERGVEWKKQVIEALVEASLNIYEQRALELDTVQDQAGIKRIADETNIIKAAIVSLAYDAKDAGEAAEDLRKIVADEAAQWGI
jgi:hypothetical protein